MLILMKESGWTVVFLGMAGLLLALPLVNFSDQTCLPASFTRITLHFTKCSPPPPCPPPPQLLVLAAFLGFLLLGCLLLQQLGPREGGPGRRSEEWHKDDLLKIFAR